MATSPVLLRIGTPSAQRSLAISLQSSAFRGLRDETAARQRQSTGRALITLILDHAEQCEPFAHAMPFIHATNKPRSAWLAEL